MANSKLLKEAIADAKAVRETALANAKIALEEAFTPRLQSILSKKLKEEAEAEADAEEKDKKDENVSRRGRVREELDSSEIGTGTEDSPKDPQGFDADTDLSVGVKKSSAAPGAEVEDYEKVTDLDERTGKNLSLKQIRERFKQRLKEDEQEVEMDGEKKSTEESVKKLRERIYKRLAEMNDGDSGETSESRVKALREKLIKRLAELDGMGDMTNQEEGDEDSIEGEGMYGEDDTMPTPTKDDTNSFGEDDDDMDLDFGDEDGEDYDVTGDEEEDTEDDMDLETIIRELERSVKEEEEPSSDEPSNEDPTEEPMDEDALSSGDPAGTDKGEDPKVVMAEEEEDENTDVTGASGEAPRGSFDTNEVLDLEEILREMERDLKEDGDEDKKEMENERKQMKEMKKSLKEAYETIQSLRGTINEVNLLNAKLLFANKLFRAHNLTNEQKVRIIESLDRTKTVREVKLVYSSLAENLRFGVNTKSSKKSITEGMASKVVKSTKPAQKQVISEGNEFAARFKKLAGIIK